jgi:predicted MFS family arabinose efflux permease
MSTISHLHRSAVSSLHPMQSPVRLVTLLRPSTRRDLLAATALSSLVFTATPFLLPAVSRDYDVSLTTASLISTMQLLGFVVASSASSRVLRPSRKLLGAALATIAVTNLAPILLGSFQLLLGARFVSGLALGTVAWLGWQEVFGDEERMGDVAVIGPVMGIAGAPIAGILADIGGADAVFAGLALLAVLPIPFMAGQPPLTDRGPARRRRSRPIPVTWVILACLGALTMGGSAVFVFGAAIGADRLGLDATVVALAFSANAALGIPSARYRGRRRLSGLWLLGTAVCAIVMATVANGIAWWFAVALWGFVFWAGVPGAFTLLSERSRHPVDRAGDAQAIMAAGRVAGPVFGGALIGAGSFTVLGLAAGGLMAAASLTLVAVELLVAPNAASEQRT